MCNRPLNLALPKPGRRYQIYGVNINFFPCFGPFPGARTSAADRPANAAASLFSVPGRLSRGIPGTAFYVLKAALWGRLARGLIQAGPAELGCL